MSEHQTRHPRADEATKHGLWGHLHSSGHTGRMPGFVTHYTKPILVEIHRDLHKRGDAR